MFPLPKKEQGRLIAQSRINMGGDKYREAGQEVPEAFEWRNLQDLLKVGKLKFEPKEKQDPALPGQALAMLSDEKLRELCAIRKVDSKGTRAELTDRLLDAAGYTRAAPKTTTYRPRPYEASRGAPTIPQLETGAIRQPGAPIGELDSAAEVDATLAKLDTMSDAELRKVGKLNNVNVAPERTRDQLIVDLAEAMHRRKLPVAPASSPAPKTSPVDRPATENPKPDKKTRG